MKTWTQPGDGYLKPLEIKEDIVLMDLNPKHYKDLKKELQKIEKRVGFSTMEDGDRGLYITDIKNDSKTKKAVEDTLKKLRIRNPQDVDMRVQ